MNLPAGAERHLRRVQAAHQAIVSLPPELEAALKQKPIPIQVRRPHTKRTWRDLIVNELIARDGAHCYLCRTPLDTTLAASHIDHVAPKSLGGDHLLHNLALTCPDCNTRKADKIVAFHVSSHQPWYILQAQITSFHQ